MVSLVGNIGTNLITNGIFGKENGANGKNGNIIGKNGTNVNIDNNHCKNVTNQWYHWENPEHTHSYAFVDRTASNDLKLMFSIMRFYYGKQDMPSCFS